MKTVASNPRMAPVRLRSHQWLDSRSRVLHLSVAQKLRSQAELWSVVEGNLERWLKHSENASLVEWRRIIQTWPREKILELIESTDETSNRLRQSSPFAGVLTPEERQAVLDAYETAGA